MKFPFGLRFEQTVLKFFIVLLLQEKTMRTIKPPVLFINHFLYLEKFSLAIDRFRENGFLKKLNEKYLETSGICKKGK